MNIERRLRKDPVILVVEDDTSDFQLVEVALKRTAGAIRLMRVEDGDSAVSYLAGDGPYQNRAEYPLPITMLLDIKLQAFRL